VPRGCRKLDSELPRAGAENEVVLYYQPQVRLRDGAIVGAQPLLRWRHPQRGILAPGTFIEVLAEYARSTIARHRRTRRLRVRLS
jgi:EAL domain-containing protein (putative c-di-GMP-specific phosphodiesterase class I)